MKASQPFRSKLASYSALVAAALAGSKESGAQILYADVEPDSITNIPGVYVLDLNNDGTSDFKFNLLETDSGNGNQIRAIGYGNNQLLRDLDDWPGTWQQYQYAAALASGSLINVADSFKKQEILGSYYTNGNYFGAWPGADGMYLGLKLVENSNNYYGWARLSIDSACAVLTSMEYAMDTIPSEGILAGDKCGNYASLVTTNVTPSGNAIFCEASFVTLLVDSIPGFTYQWLKNDTVIAGAENYSYDANAEGAYRVIASNSYGCADTSEVVQVTPVPLPPTPVITQSGNLLSSTEAESYQWYWNGELIPGATEQDYEPLQGGDYTVLITDANGCSSLSEPFTFIPVGIPDAQVITATITVSDNQVSIQLQTDDLLHGRISLMNMMGKEVYSSLLSSSKMSIDLNGLEKGLYIIRIRKADAELTRKLTVQ